MFFVRVLLLVVGVAVLATPTAQAEDSVASPPSVVTRLQVTATSPVPAGRALAVRAGVAPAAAANPADVTLPLVGEVRFALDGEAFAAVPVRRDGTAPVTVPESLLDRGTHRIRATYVPEAGSGYLASSGTTEIEVRACRSERCRQARASLSHGDDGLLAGASGLVLGVALLAIVFLGLGAGIVLAGRGLDRRA